MTPPATDLIAGASLMLAALAAQLRANQASGAECCPAAIADDLDRIIRQLAAARGRIAPATPPKILEVSLVDNVIPIRSRP